MSKTIVKKVESEMHINKFEHTAFGNFFKSIFIATFLGLLIGALVDKAVKWGQDQFTDGRFTCAAFTVAHLSVIIVLLYTFNRAPFIRKTLYFDDWLWNTFAGFMFAILFMAAQFQLTSNIRCALF